MPTITIEADGFLKPQFKYRPSRLRVNLQLNDFWACQFAEGTNRLFTAGHHQCRRKVNPVFFRFLFYLFAHFTIFSCIAQFVQTECFCPSFPSWLIHARVPERRRFPQAQRGELRAWISVIVWYHTSIEATALPNIYSVWFKRTPTPIIEPFSLKLYGDEAAAFWREEWTTEKISPSGLFWLGISQVPGGWQLCSFITVHLNCAWTHTYTRAPLRCITSRIAVLSYTWTNITLAVRNSAVVSVPGDRFLAHRHTLFCGCGPLPLQGQV